MLTMLVFVNHANYHINYGGHVEKMLRYALKNHYHELMMPAERVDANGWYQFLFGQLLNLTVLFIIITSRFLQCPRKPNMGTSLFTGP